MMERLTVRRSNLSERVMDAPTCVDGCGDFLKCTAEKDVDTSCAVGFAGVHVVATV